MPAAAAWETDSQVFEVGEKGVSDYSKVVDEWEGRQTLAVDGVAEVVHGFGTNKDWSAFIRV